MPIVHFGHKATPSHFVGYLEMGQGKGKGEGRKGGREGRGGEGKGGILGWWWN